MRLSEAFDRRIVVPDAPACIDTAGIETLCASASAVLLATPGMAAAVQQHADALVEQADARRWSALFLAHEPEPGEAQGRCGDLVRCAIPPTAVTVLAIRPALLRRVLDSMPTGAQAASLGPVDWLTMVSWMLLDYAPPGTVWGAYPGLVPVRSPEPGISMH